MTRLKYPAVYQTRSYWTALQDGRSIPKRSQIDPRGLEDVLEYVFILERIAPGFARFCLAGGHLNTLMEMELRGMSAATLFVADDRRALSG